MAFEAKSDVGVLKAKFQDAFARKDYKNLKNNIKKVVGFMSLGIDVLPLFPEMIMASATNDIVQKKLVYLYICSCAESKKDLAVLTVNSLVKDAQFDPNPMIRGLALRSMSNIRIESLAQYMIMPLKSGLSDNSPYVRRNAVMAASKLFHIAPHVFEDMNLISKLYEMLRDYDPQVSINAFTCLDEVLAQSGGFIFERKYIAYLLDRLPKYSEWSQCLILQKLTKYEPDDDDEIIEYLNLLDNRLKHANKGVVMAVIKIFLHFTKNMGNIHNDVYDRIKGPLLSMLTSSIPEVVYTVLNHVIVLASMKPRLFNKNYKSFLLRHNEPSYVQQKKLHVLTEIVTEGNLQDIIDELRWYARDADISICCQAIKSIGKIAAKNPTSIQTCISTIIEILHFDVDYITSNCLEILQELMMVDSSVTLQVLPELSSCWQQVQDYSKGKAAIIWVYGEYGEDIMNAPYHLEELINEIEHEQSALVKLNLLTAMMKLFFKRPPECQHSLGNLLRYCVDDETNMEIRDRALFYYRLLQNVEEAKAVVMSSTIQDTTVMINSTRRKQIEDFHFIEFNTLSIVYDQPSTMFKCQFPWIQDNQHKEQQSDYNHSDPPKLKSADNEVVEAKILDFTDESDGNDGITFDCSYVMNQNDYQQLWRTFSSKLSCAELLTVAPEYDEILAVMNSKGIQVMASSQLSDPFWRFLMYAKQANSENIFLVQLEIYHQERRLSILAKSEYEDKLNAFMDAYKDIFVGKWIACSP